jgi:hypothetical protein
LSVEHWREGTSMQHLRQESPLRRDLPTAGMRFQSRLLRAQPPAQGPSLPTCLANESYKQRAVLVVGLRRCSLARRRLRRHRLCRRWHDDSCLAGGPCSRLPRRRCRSGPGSGRGCTVPRGGDRSSPVSRRCRSGQLQRSTRGGSGHRAGRGHDRRVVRWRHRPRVDVVLAGAAFAVRVE